MRPTCPDPSTTERGFHAQSLAEQELVGRGYRVLERNFRCRQGELDLICIADGELVFVEVRSRRSGRWGSAIATVGPRKQRQLARVAAVFLSRQRRPGMGCRFDVVGVTGDVIEVVVDAFRPPVS